MKKIGLTFFILISYTLFSFAQNEGNIWYFGANAGLDFNSGSPVALTDGMLNTVEGCASIADINGDLLFYTDGMTVYNKNHTIMPNGSGLLGHNSSTQSAIIVKKPASTTIYYLFTVDGFTGNSGGLNYSEVDITLQGGLCDINLNKNINIVPGTCEKVTAIKHQNGTDFWIIVRLENSNTYHSYLFASSGLNMVPVVTNIGPIYNGTAGYLRGSPSGERIAAGNFFALVEEFNIFDFDNLTGALSNGITIPFSNPYGVEFSPDGNLLYISSSGIGSIYQYNLLASNVASSQVLLSSSMTYCGAIQSAPDNKIYFADVGASYLAVVNNPNTVGVGCNFNLSGVYLGGKLSQGGLPTFYSSIFVSTNSFSFNNPCYGDSAIFNISNMSLDSVVWNFGDPISGINNISTNINPFHIFSDTGTFHITLYSYFNGMIDTVVNDLFVTAIPVVNLGNDTVICDGEILTLNASAQNATYLWQDNSVNSNYTVAVEGEYFVEVTIDGCSALDTIIVIYSSLPNAIISGDYEVCYGEQVFIDVNLMGSAPFEITYTNGTQTNLISGEDPIIIEASQTGIYTITNVVDQFGCFGNYSGSAEVIINVCTLTVFIPNSFTPDNDSNNEGFIPSIYDINNVISFNMKIFNRWGDMIYETNEKEEYWDGSFNNTYVQKGVYTYTITITDIFEKLNSFTGYVTLIR